MSIRVMKFGGTSVATVDKINKVAQKILQAKKNTDSIVVVISAMAGVTDRLIEYLKSIDEDYSLREYDQLVSTGENSNIPLLVQSLLALGIKAKSFTGQQAGIYTDNAYSKARVKNVDASLLKKELDKGVVCVVAGFQGYNIESGDITTLGRGGSDTTAVVLSAALKATVCEIYTDVDGVYTADPRIVRSAKKLDVISHEEMLELSSLGAKVLVSRCLELGMNYNVDITVLSSIEDKPGTLVTSKVDNMEKVVVSGVASDKNQAKITVRNLENKPGVAANIFSKLAEANLNVDMIVQNFPEASKASISFTVPKTELLKGVKICQSLADNDPNIKVDYDENVSKISIVGVGMKSHSGVAATLFKCLAENSINIEMITTSEIKISCLIQEKFTELAVMALHNEFIDKQVNVNE